MSLARRVAVLLAVEVLWGGTFASPATAPRSVIGDPLRGNGNVSRKLLTREQLFSDQNVTAPVDDSAFAIPENAAIPSDSFEGRLELLNTASSGGFNLFHKEFKDEGDPSPWMHLPAFSFEFVQNGSHLIPVKQGLVITGSPAWNYIIGQGRVWRENGDGGYARASFPFALVERNQNCVHNGEMTFLFSSRKSPLISRVRYQVTQETCRYMKFDMWGQVAANYSAYRVESANLLKDEFADEIAHRVPRKPFSQITGDFPQSGVDPAGFFRTLKFPKDITTYGLYINGVHYTGNCQTRYGEYAFCDEMRLPSYSTAKSAFASVAMMRLSELYGHDVYSQLIRDFVPESTLGGDWSNVTFANNLDMASGNYNRTEFEADEDGPEEIAFLVAESYKDKIADAFKPFPHKSDPGKTWIYQSHATFIVTQAMTGFLQKQRGSGADLFSLVRDDVYEAIHWSKGALTTIRTDNSETGRPSGYYGLFYIPDDVVKIARLLNDEKGRINGEQVLDASDLADSLLRGGSLNALPVPDVGDPAVKDTFYYHHAFWLKHITPREFPEYSCDFWIPYMSGYGGNTILLLPKGVTYYLFSDANEFNWYTAVSEVNKISHFCEANAPTGH